MMYFTLPLYFFIFLVFPENSLALFFLIMLVFLHRYYLLYNDPEIVWLNLHNELRRANLMPLH